MPMNRRASTGSLPLGCKGNNCWKFSSSWLDLAGTSIFNACRLAASRCHVSSLPSAVIRSPAKRLISLVGP